MRKLNTSDAFAFMRVIKAANMREELKQIAEKIKKEKKTAEAAGTDVIMSIMAGLSDENAEKEFYKFIARIVGETEEEIGRMDLADFFEAIKAIIENEDKGRWAAFFESVLSLTK